MPQDSVTTQIATLECQQGQLSRAIGQAKRNGEHFEPLLEKMRTVSHELKSLKKQTTSTQKREHQLSKRQVKLPALFTPVIDGANPQQFEFTITQFSIDDSAAALKWQKYVGENSRCSIYHSYEFRQVIEQSFKHKTYYFYAIDSSGELVGILPSVHIKSKLFGNYAVSMPYFNYGGAIAESPTIELALMQHAWKFYCTLGANHIEFRDVKMRPSLNKKTGKVAMLLELPNTKEQLWASIGSKVRAQIKKSQRFVTNTRFGGIELLDDFYAVFSERMRDLGTPVYGKSFFANLINANRLHIRLAVCYSDNRPAGCALLIGSNDCMEIPWASTLRKFNAQNINMLMYWEILGYAIANQYAFFDFGRSSKGAGTYKFKSQWGAKPQQLFWHYCLPEGRTMPEINPDNPKYRLLIAIWQRMPVWCTRLVGPHIVKNLP